MTAKTRCFVLYVLRLRVIDCNRKLIKAKAESNPADVAHWTEELADASVAIAELEAM